MNNIAEGFERRSDKEFEYFLFIVKGSSCEVRSMLHIAKELNKISDEQYERLNTLSIDISKLIYGLIKSLH